MRGRAERQRLEESGRRGVLVLDRQVRLARNSGILLLTFGTFRWPVRERNR